MVVLPITAPLDNVNASMPSGPAGPPKRETSPVGVPEPDVTFMVTLTGWPCVRVIGLVGGVVESANMVLVEWKLAFVQFFTRFAAFTVPSVGADVLDNPAVARRNSLQGPGTWGVNLGLNKSFRFGERVRANLGADFNNLFNHPLFSPDQGGESIANLGNFSIHVDPATKRILPITDVTRNPDFGRLLTSYSQEGVDARRMVRLKLRITF